MNLIACECEARVELPRHPESNYQVTYAGGSIYFTFLCPECEEYYLTAQLHVSLTNVTRERL